MPLEIVILAAGKGSRMQSGLPKVLHSLAGKSLLSHVLETAQELKPDHIYVVVGYQSELVQASIATSKTKTPIQWVTQTEQLGTGHAVRQVLPLIKSDSTVLILPGDVPLIKSDTLRKLIQSDDDELNTGIHLLTTIVDDANGLGRIIRDQSTQDVEKIIEHKDANGQQRKIREINTAVMAVSGVDLGRWLEQVGTDNAQKEYYLTDIVALAVQEGHPVKATIASDPRYVMGINTRAQLAQLERIHQAELAAQLMHVGISIADPARIDIRGKLTAGQDCFIDINVIFEQRVKLGNHVVIGPNVVIRNSYIGDNCTIEANSVIDNATIAAECNIGPFARIRPETHLAQGSKIGNFVEIKKSKIGSGSKVNHLSYIGDSVVGENVNIGAGVITCNYDGANKYQTLIGDDVFVGSGCQLRAPIKIGDGATIGAGTTLRKDAPANMLSVSMARQTTFKNWSRPVKKKQ